MKPPRFRYVAPRSIDETLAALAEYGDEAKILAGGQSLVPLLNFRLARPGVIVDINGIRSLAYLRRRDNTLAIGAMTRQRAVETSAVVRRWAPLLWEGIRLVGHPQIRTRGTVGGSIAHADPSAELPAVLAALDGEAVVRGPEGERIIAASEFFTGYLATALGPADLLTEVRFLLPAPPAGTAFLEVARRHGDFAIVGAAAVLRRHDGAVADVRLVFTGVGPGPVRADEAAQLLTGSPGSTKAFTEAARAAAQRLDPDADIHASAEYRREVAAVMARRALELAWQRSGRTARSGRGTRRGEAQ
ncbi:MAG: FAD binding domain-containing protein [bacterium]